MIGSLNFFRFISILYIAFFHLSQNTYTKGYICVEFFFILSGYLLGNSLEKKQITFKEFIINKFIRLYPVFIVSNLLMIIVLLIFNNKIDIISFINTILFTSFSPFLNKTPIISWFCPALFWGSIILFLIVNTNKMQNKTKMLVCFSISIFLYCFILFTTHTLSYNTYKYFNFLYKGTLRSVAGLSLGMAIFFLIQNNIIKINKSILEYLEIITIILAVCVFCIIKNTVLFSIMAIVLFALIIFIYSFNKTFVAKILDNNISNFLGQISFSIYLTHTIIIRILKNIQDDININKILYIVLVIIVGIIYYYVIEKNIKIYYNKL